MNPSSVQENFIPFSSTKRQGTLSVDQVNLLWQIFQTFQLQRSLKNTCCSLFFKRTFSWDCKLLLNSTTTTTTKMIQDFPFSRWFCQNYSRWQFFLLQKRPKPFPSVPVLKNRIDSRNGLCGWVVFCSDKKSDHVNKCAAVLALP